jgi:hypothetical protein
LLNLACFYGALLWHSIAAGCRNAHSHFTVIVPRCVGDRSVRLYVNLYVFQDTQRMLDVGKVPCYNNIYVFSSIPVRIHGVLYANAAMTLFERKAMRGPPMGRCTYTCSNVVAAAAARRHPPTRPVWMGCCHNLFELISTAPSGPGTAEAPHRRPPWAYTGRCVCEPHFALPR